MLRVLIVLFFSKAHFFLQMRRGEFHPADWDKSNDLTVRLKDRITDTVVKRKLRYSCPVNAWVFLLHPIKACRYLRNCMKANVPHYFVRDYYKDVQI